MSFKISPPISWSKFWFRDCITTRNAMDLSFCIPRNEKLQLLHVAKRWERELIYFWFVFFYLFALYYALDFSTYLNCWTYVLNLLSSLFFLSKRTFYRPFFQGRKIGGDITKNLSRKALVPHGHTDGRTDNGRTMDGQRMNEGLKWRQHITIWFLCYGVVLMPLALYAWSSAIIEGFAFTRQIAHHWRYTSL